jgi:hypothetical protein
MKTSLKRTFAFLLLLSSFNISQSLTLLSFADDDRYENQYESEDDQWKEDTINTARRYYSKGRSYQEYENNVVATSTNSSSTPVVNDTLSIPINTSEKITPPVSQVIKKNTPNTQARVLAQKKPTANTTSTTNSIANSNISDYTTPISLFIGANGKTFTIIENQKEDSFSFIENDRVSSEHFSHKAEVIAYLNSFNHQSNGELSSMQYRESNSLSPEYARAVAEAEAQVKILQMKGKKKAFVLERPIVPTRLNALLTTKEALAQSEKNITIELQKPLKTVPQKKITAPQPKVIATPKIPTKVVTQKPVTSPKPTPTPVIKPVVKPTPPPVVVTPAPEPTVQLPPPSTRTRAS